MFTKNVCKEWGTFASPSVNFNNFRGPRVRFLPDILKNENFEISIISNLVSGTCNFFCIFLRGRRATVYVPYTSYYRYNCCGKNGPYICEQ